MHDTRPSNLLTLQIPEGRLEIEESLGPFLPPAFVADPMKYFEDQGAPIRQGEITYDEGGRIHDDPTAVRTSRRG